MADESIYDQRERVRKPRVHINYKVETENGTEKRGLPFNLGVLGDFSGDPTGKLKPLAEREFVQIDRDNFDEVLKRMKPGLNLRVENTLEGDGTEFGVHLEFGSLQDFEPGNLVQQIEPLRKLMETRNQLKDLQSKVAVSPDFEKEVAKALKSPDDRKQLAGELGSPPPTSPNPPSSTSKPPQAKP